MPPQRVLTGTYVAFAVAVACGAYLAYVAGPEMLAVGVVSIAAGVLYTGGPRPVRLRRPGRAVRVPVLRPGGGDRLLLRADRGAHVGVAGAGGAGRAAGRGDPGGEQRARHRHRPARRQAHAGGEARPRAGPDAVRRDAGAWPTRCPIAIPRGRRPVVVGAAAAGSAAARARRSGRRSPPGPTGPPSTTPWRARGGCWPCSRCCSRRASCSRETLAAAAGDPAARPVRDRGRRGVRARDGGDHGSRTTTAAWASARPRRWSPTTA